MPFTLKQANKILRDLKRLNRNRVYVMDVQARNYVGGLLVDMSVAMTEPHYLFAIRPEWRVNEFRLADMYSYDIMMKDENIPTWDRAIRNENYCTTKLRSRNTEGKVAKRWIPRYSVKSKPALYIAMAALAHNRNISS